MSKIGFIGLGRMGKGMASNLQKKGFQLVVLDVNPAPVKELVALGATAGQSVAHIARAALESIAYQSTALLAPPQQRSPRCSHCPFRRKFPTTSSASAS
mgnify:CR=1 FL=1